MLIQSTCPDGTPKKTGDYPASVVTDAAGNKIPRMEISHFDDDAAPYLMQQITIRLYPSHRTTDDLQFHEQITRWAFATGKRVDHGHAVGLQV